jgi:hypothetical protein
MDITIYWPIAATLSDHKKSAGRVPDRIEDARPRIANSWFRAIALSER